MHIATNSTNTHCVKFRSLHIKGTFASLSLSFPNNTVSCIVGKSGSGKTTFIKTLLDEHPAVTIRKNFYLAYLTHPSEICPYLTIIENIILSFSRFIPSHLPLLNIDCLRDVFSKFHLNYALKLYPHQVDHDDLILTGLISLLLVPEHAIVVLDEPLCTLKNKNSIGLEMFKMFVSELKKKNNMSLIYSTNNAKQMDFADRIIVLDPKIQGIKKIFERYSQKKKQALQKMLYGS